MQNPVELSTLSLRGGICRRGNPFVIGDLFRDCFALIAMTTLAVLKLIADFASAMARKERAGIDEPAILKDLKMEVRTSRQARIPHAANNLVFADALAGLDVIVKQMGVGCLQAIPVIDAHVIPVAALAARGSNGSCPGSSDRVTNGSLIIQTRVKRYYGANSPNMVMKFSSLGI
jgi:hypothetical protein